MMDDSNWQRIRSQLAETERLLQDETSAEVREQLLAQRAEQLSQISGLQRESETALAVLTFTAGPERYGVPVHLVRTVVRLQHITPVPCTPSFYLGVANINGAIITILDLAQFFELESTSQHITHAVVVHSAGLEIGFATGDLLNVVRVSKEALHKPPLHDSEPIQFIDDNGLIVLDVASLFNDPALRIYEEPR